MCPVDPAELLVRLLAGINLEQPLRSVFQQYPDFLHRLPDYALVVTLSTIDVPGNRRVPAPGNLSLPSTSSEAGPSRTHRKPGRCADLCKRPFRCTSSWLARPITVSLLSTTSNHPSIRITIFSLQLKLPHRHIPRIGLTPAPPCP